MREGGDAQRRVAGASLYANGQAACAPEEAGPGAGVMAARSRRPRLPGQSSAEIAMAKPRQIVLVHGWSDRGGSFKTLQQVLRQRLQADTHVIRLADWLSLEDDVGFRDLAQAMQRAWLAAGLPREPRAVDVVTHSTGALVVREWMTTFHTAASVPVKRFVQLAPANFGSPLAHKGHSFIARAVKGWGSGMETGRRLLHGLELGSPYTWQLAGRDLFVPPEARWYGRDRLLATVLIGDTGYSGISSIANEPGTDGTVRAACANLQAEEVSLHFPGAGQPPIARRVATEGATAFGILAGENHSTIAFKDGGPRSPVTLELLLGALAVEDADFPASPGDAFGWQARVEALAPPLAAGRPERQHTVVHLHDHLGQDVEDYFVEFYLPPGTRPKRVDAAFEQRFYRDVIAGVHAYGPNPAWRALNLDTAAFAALAGAEPMDPLCLSVSASPEYKPPRQRVGYRSFRDGDLGALAIPRAKHAAFFSPHRTLLLRLSIPRVIDDDVFALGPAA